MDTQEKAKEISRFIILIPHRDSIKPLVEFRQKLFAAGYPGAWSFPVAAPLASVSRSFNRDELKALARDIRFLTKENDGKISSDCSALAGCSGKFTFFGPRLGLPSNENLFPKTALEKILYIFFPPVLCTALVNGNSVSEEAPAVSFRAASLANLAIRPLGAGESAYSFEWKIGPPVWLPKYRKE